MTLRSAWFHRSPWRANARAVFATAFAATCLGGCSLFYDLNTTQCEVTSDCTAFGPQFANTECINRVCVPKSDGTGGMTSSSMGGKSGMSGGTGGTNASGGDTALGGEGGDIGAGGVLGSSGGTAGTSGGTAGTGGSGPPPECLSNGDCIDAHVDQPFICRDAKCVQVTTDECPVLLPTNKTLELLRKSSPILIGGYATMSNAQDPHDTQAVINWDLAFDEFNSSTFGGLPASGGELRPLLGLICQGKTTDVSPSMAHLTSDIRVPAILSTLTAENLYAAFQYTQTSAYAASGADPVFFMSTGSADSRLANMPDDGLVWHMLGEPRLMAAITASWVKRIEPVINAKRKAACPASPAACVDDPDKVPLRVTLVYSDEPTMTDVATVLTNDDAAHPETLLTFNGAAATDAPNATNFRQVSIQSIKTHTTTPDVSAALADLQSNPPHLIIAMATAEFPKQVLPTIENNWGKSGTASEGMQRPYYVMSHLIYPSQELLTVAAQFAGLTPPVHLRTTGVNYAAAQDDHSKRLYTAYLSRLQNSYHGTLNVSGVENHYDGAYSLLYALAAATAARTMPKAGDIRDGLTGRIFNTSAGTNIVDVGPTNIPTSIGKLNGDFMYKMELWGCMGPPNFDRLSGTRLSDTSMYCVQQNGSAWAYQADGLLYDATAKTFGPPATGVPGCLQAY